MFRYKTKERALAIGALIILLCLISLTGATYALFTAGGEDGKIGINATAGYIDIDIIQATDDKPQSLVGKVLNFMPNAENPTILFEPGATFYTEGFQIKNNGNIIVNYIIYISEDEAYTEGFYDAFDVWITTAIDERIPPEELPKFEGRLIPEQTSEIYYLVFRMKETAGNEFQNKRFEGVGITVCATQGNVYYD